MHYITEDCSLHSTVPDSRFTLGIILQKIALCIPLSLIPGLHWALYYRRLLSAFHCPWFQVYIVHYITEDYSLHSTVPDSRFILCIILQKITLCIPPSLIPGLYYALYYRRLLSAFHRPWFQVYIVHRNMWFRKFSEYIYFNTKISYLFWPGLADEVNYAGHLGSCLGICTSNPHRLSQRTQLNMSTLFRRPKNPHLHFKRCLMYLKWIIQQTLAAAGRALSAGQADQCGTTTIMLMIQIIE